MQTTEINGFLIDEFNQHKLEEGKKQGICPLCSHTRKPKNQKAKCASYDWERGLGTCHNCNTTFNFTHTNVKVKLLRYMKDPNKRLSNHLIAKLLNGLNQEVYLRKPLLT